MPTITDADLGQEIATNGVLQSITLTTPPSVYALDDYFCLTDGDQVLFNMHIATSAVSSGSLLLANGAISFASLTVKSKSAGSVFDYELAPPPVLTSLSPNTAVSGTDPDFVLSCIGSAFTEATIIVFGNYDEPTTLVSDTEVTTIVKPSLFVAPDTVPVTVRNGTLVSSPVDFTFT